MKYALASIAALSAGAFAAPGAMAQHYSAHSHYAPQMTYEQCVRQQQNRQVTGAVVGGLLGAVAGAQIHNATKPRNTAPPPRRGHWGGRHHQPQSSNSSNAGAVVAGGAIGALAGAAVTGNTNCNQFPRQQAAYGHGGAYHGGYAQDPYAYSHSSYGYDGYDYGYGYDGYGYDGYAAPSSGGVLMGGEDYGYPQQPPARTYTAGSAQLPPPGAACRYMASGNGAQVFMCQGADGIWRPGY